MSPGFCLLVAWFASANGWRVTGLILSAALLHELGHWLALRLCGAGVSRLHLGVLGAVMETDAQRLPYGAELFCILAGPAVNLSCALGLGALGGAPEALGAHLVLGLFNLLPLRPLDGGRALETLLSALLGPAAGERITGVLGTGTALALAAALGAVMLQSGGSLWLLPAALGGLAAAGRECFGKQGFL